MQIALHPDIETAISIIVARNSDEAARIERGEDVTQLREELSPEEAAVQAAEAFFEPEAAQALNQRENAERRDRPGRREEIIRRVSLRAASVGDMIARNG